MIVADEITGYGGQWHTRGTLVPKCTLVVCDLGHGRHFLATDCVAAGGGPGIFFFISLIPGRTTGRKCISFVMMNQSIGWFDERFFLTNHQARPVHRQATSSRMIIEYRPRPTRGREAPHERRGREAPHERRGCEAPHERSEWESAPPRGPKGSSEPTAWAKNTAIPGSRGGGFFGGAKRWPGPAEGAGPAGGHPQKKRRPGGAAFLRVSSSSWTSGPGPLSAC